MIQDIRPHNYNNHYEEYRAEKPDHCIVVKDRKALLARGRDGWYVPDFEELGLDTRGAVYLFAIDGCHYFLKQVSQESAAGSDRDSGRTEAFIPESMLKEISDGHFSWKSRRDMREVAPRFVAFAGVTALQLDGWYNSNRFCGHCGSRLVPDHAERMLYCDKCKNQVYPRINPAVIIAVTDKSRLLMTKYAGNSYTRYALVAGFTEIGETLEETVKREVMEETGLRVKNLCYYKSQPWSFSDTLLSGFFCEVDGDTQIKIDENELSVAQWVEKDQINQVQESYDDISLTNEMIQYFRDHGAPA